MSATTGTPPGWYPQPDGTQRYWDGAAWTSHVAPGLPAFATGPQLLTPQDGQPWPPVATSPGRYTAQPGGAIRYTAAPYGAGRSPDAPKSPGLALVASFLVPGLGQLVNGELLKGAGFLLAYLLSMISVVVLVGFVAVPVVWVWAMVDAYRSAQEWNLRHGMHG